MMCLLTLLVAFTIPEGFALQERAPHVTQIDDPEHALSLFMVELDGDDLEHALSEAWKKAGREAPRLRKLNHLPASKGFEAWIAASYVTEDPAHRSMAFGKKHGRKIYVLLAEGEKAQLDKRRAQIQTIFDQIKGESINLSAAPLHSVTQNLHELDTFIEDVLQQSGIPGLSIAIVEDGHPVWIKGYGVCDTETETRVTADTQMRIGSLTKSMTAFLLARLVEQGTLTWDTRVVDLCPKFQVDDPELTQKITLENLLCACTGLPRKDLPMILSQRNRDVPEERLFSVLATMRPTTGFKETFQYQNQLVTLAGYMAARAHNRGEPMRQHYKTLMRSQVFEPLDMHRTSFIPLDENVAVEHAIDQRTHTMVRVGDVIDKMIEFDLPAGGVWSTANDMARYLAYEIQTQKPEDLHRRKPQVQTGEGSFYGLGWFCNQNKGITKVHHAGGVYGFSSIMAFYPEKKCGFVILGNAYAVHAFEEAIGKKIMELWFGIDKQSKESVRLAVEAQKSEDFASKVVDDPTWLRKFVGIHTNPLLGEFHIEESKPNVFSLHLLETTFTLVIHEEGGVRTIRLLEPPFEDFALFPTEDGSFEMREAQQVYRFVGPNGH